MNTHATTSLADHHAYSLSCMAGTEESGDAMTFVGNWIARLYDSELHPASMYNDLHNVYRNKYGRNALGLRNALQHYVKLGAVETAKGSSYQQMYTLAGTSDDLEEPTQEFLSLQTDDARNASIASTQVNDSNTGVDDQGDTKYPL